MSTHELDAAARTAPISGWMRAYLEVVDEGCPLTVEGTPDGPATRLWRDLVFGASLPLDAPPAPEHGDEPLHFTCWLARKANLVARSGDALRLTRRGEAFGDDPGDDAVALIVAFAEKARWATRRAGAGGAGFFDKRVTAMTARLMRRIDRTGPRFRTAELVDEVFAVLERKWILRQPPGAPNPKSRLERAIADGLLAPLAWLGAVELERRPSSGIVAATPTVLLRAYVERADERAREHRIRGVSIAMRATSARHLLDACVRARLDPDELAEAGRAYRDVNGEDAETELAALFEGAGPNLFALCHLAGDPSGKAFGAPPTSVDAVAQVTAWMALGAIRHAGKWEALRIVAAAPDWLGWTLVERIGTSGHPQATMLLRSIERHIPTLACAALTQLYPPSSDLMSAAGNDGTDP